MTTRNMVIGIIIAALIAVPIIWWLASPLFVNETVNEEFPFDVPTTEQIDAMSPEEAEDTANALAAQAAAGELDADAMAAAEASIAVLAEKMPAQPMADEMPEAAAEWVTLAAGEFEDADSFHQGSGTATILGQGDQRVLRFEEFDVTNGPDLHVLLVENIDGTNHEEIGDYVDLGALKGNMGNQNYEIPADVDLSQYAGIMIYCMPFHVVFAPAAF